MKEDHNNIPPAAYRKKQLGRRETFPDIAQRMPLHDLRRLMTKTQVQAAKTIGISPTTLKKLCRHYGVPRWPFRQIAGDDRPMDRLDNMFGKGSVRKPDAAAPNPRGNDRCSSGGAGKDDGAGNDGGAEKAIARHGSASGPSLDGNRVKNDVIDTNYRALTISPHLLESSVRGGTTGVPAGATGYSYPIVQQSALPPAPAVGIAPTLGAANAFGELNWYLNSPSALQGAIGMATPISVNMPQSTTAATSTSWMCDAKSSMCGARSSGGGDGDDDDIDRNLIRSSFAAAASAAATSSDRSSPAPPPLALLSWPPPHRRSWIHPVNFPLPRPMACSWQNTMVTTGGAQPTPSTGYEHLSSFGPVRLRPNMAQPPYAAQWSGCVGRRGPALHAAFHGLGTGAMGPFGVLGAASPGNAVADAPTDASRNKVAKGKQANADGCGRQDALGFGDLCALERLLFGESNMCSAAVAVANAAAATPAAESSPHAAASANTASPVIPADPAITLGAAAHPSGTAVAAKPLRRVHSFASTTPVPAFIGGRHTGAETRSAAAKVPFTSELGSADGISKAGSEASKPWGIEVSPPWTVSGGGGGGGGICSPSPARIGADPWGIEGVATTI